MPAPSTPENTAKVRRPPTSPYRGVSRPRDCRKWRAQIRFEKKVHHLGRFDDETAAARAYDDAARRLLGTAAELNFPLPSDRAYEPYPDPERPGCYRVTVHCTDGDLEALIDAESLPLVRGQRWSWSGPRDDRSTGVIREVKAKRTLHRVVIGAEDSSQQVAHLNGDPLDCRKANLVIRTPVETAAARKPTLARKGKRCPSRFKGVTLAQTGRKWNAAISTSENGRTKVIQLGMFRSEIDAALAYDAAALEMHGEHAGLNLPDPAEVERLRATDTPFKPLYDTFPPEGWLTRDDARAMFGVCNTTWHNWQHQGRLDFGQFFTLPEGKRGRCKLYPIEELKRLKEELSRIGQPYPDPDHPGCYRVPISGYIQYREVIVDAETLPLMEGRTWNWTPRHADTGVEGQVILATTRTSHPTLARLIAGITDDSNLQVQFANGDPLDCRKENLLIKTVQERTFGNGKFSSIRGRPCTSKYKGVCWDKRRGQWVAQIRKETDYRQLGRFDREIDAAWAYDEAAREMFGEEFAWLNFPDGKPRDPGEYPTPDYDALEIPHIEARTSRYVGVVWEKYMQRWFATITVDGVCRHLGNFGDDEPAAARAYDEAARQAHGEWATLNFPTEAERSFAAQWYDSHQASKYLGITVGMWKNWIKDGKTPPGRKVPAAYGGQRWVFPFDELERMKSGMEFGKIVHRPGESKAMLTHGKTTSSRYRGVSYCKCTGRWRAIICYQGKTHRLGRFDSEYEAAVAHDAKARALLGSKAWVNFPHPHEMAVDGQSTRRAAA